MDTMTKVTVTVPSQYVRDIRESVEQGKARSVSAFITEAIETKIDHADDDDVLEQIIAAHPQPTPAQQAWVADAMTNTYGFAV